MQVRGEGEAVRDGVAEPGGGLGVAEDDGPGGVVVTQQGPHPHPQAVPGGVDDGGPLGDVLAEHVRHQQVGPLGVAAQGEPEQLADAVTAQLDAEAVGDPLAGPDAGRARHAGTHADSSSTKPISSRATPKTSARRRVRSAQARCGFTSFILLV